MDETRAYILQIFEKYKLRAGHYIDNKWLIFAYEKANILVQDNFYDTLKQMDDEGFFEYKEGHGETLFLTNIGEEAVTSYIKERSKNMPSDKLHIEVNPTIAPVFTQTNTQEQNNTMNQIQKTDLWLLIKDKLDEEKVKELESIVQANIPQNEKLSKITTFLQSLGISVIANILATLITNYPIN